MCVYIPCSAICDLLAVELAAIFVAAATMQEVTVSWAWDLHVTKHECSDCLCCFFRYVCSLSVCILFLNTVHSVSFLQSAFPKILVQSYSLAKE